MSEQYDQTKSENTKYSCTIYTMLNIIKYDFWVEVSDSIIFKIVAYMEGIGALWPKWAYFSVIYSAMVKLIEYKTWFKLKIKKSSISKWLDDKSMWALWFKKLSDLSIGLAKDDHWITTFDIQEIAKSHKWSGHNHAVKLWNVSNKWTVLDSWWGFTYHTSLAALKEGVLLDVYYDVARTLVAADERTKRLQKKYVSVAKRTWKLIVIK